MPHSSYIKFVICISAAFFVDMAVQIHYLNWSLFLANIVGLQLLGLWQCSADRRPAKEDSWDERELLLIMPTVTMMVTMKTITLYDRESG